MAYSYNSNKASISTGILSGREPNPTALRTYTVIRPPYGGEQLATAIDHIRMLSEIGRTIYHTQYLDHSLYLVEATKVRLDGRQHGKSYLLGGEFASSIVKSLPIRPMIKDLSFRTGP